MCAKTKSVMVVKWNWILLPWEFYVSSKRMFNGLSLKNIYKYMYKITLFNAVLSFSKKVIYRMENTLNSMSNKITRHLHYLYISLCTSNNDPSSLLNLWPIRTLNVLLKQDELSHFQPDHGSSISKHFRFVNWYYVILHFPHLYLIFSCFVSIICKRCSAYQTGEG